jgi:hypothetical protein
MENEIELQENEMSRPGETTVIASDWTESEWFDVWLKLARREYEPAKN